MLSCTLSPTDGTAQGEKKEKGSSSSRESTANGNESSGVAAIGQRAHNSHGQVTVQHCVIQQQQRAASKCRRLRSLQLG
ncbi:hypothetical protein C0Q70_16282 [Pomacea canaliculata]|uniref:Uncharacterized protein n=1 Tax=Pomacea canaliculata TaxID=400727 RepID=A0A2T7NPC6_POMCA|nr:hypothetical protein C0Q70_16282 [Pomacea canaliculata]